MQINQISFYNLNQNPQILPKANSEQTVHSKQEELTKIPSEYLKANFLPSFSGKMRKVGETTIYDRKTGEPVKATIRKETICSDYYEYNICVGRKVVGLMRLSLEAACPKYDTRFPYDNEVSQESFPQIFHLRTIEGDKYKNIGTELIKIAVQESFKSKNNGEIWLCSEKGYQKDLSPYRSNENPIPFYYKMGFRAFGDEDSIIRGLLETKDYDALPEQTVLYLPPKEARKFLF